MFAVNAGPVPVPTSPNLPSVATVTQTTAANAPTVTQFAPTPSPSILSTVQRKQQQAQQSPSQAAQSNAQPTAARAAVVSASGLQPSGSSRLEFGFSSAFLTQLFSQDIPGDRLTLRSYAEAGNFQTLQEVVDAGKEVKYLPSLAGKPSPVPPPQTAQAPQANSPIEQLQQALRVTQNQATASQTPAPTATLNTAQAASFLQAPALKEPAATSKAPSQNNTQNPSVRTRTGAAAYQATSARAQQLVARAKEDIPIATYQPNAEEVQAVDEVKR